MLQAHPPEGRPQLQPQHGPDHPAELRPLSTPEADPAHLCPWTGTQFGSSSESNASFYFLSSHPLSTSSSCPLHKEQSVQSVWVCLCEGGRDTSLSQGGGSCPKQCSYTQARFPCEKSAVRTVLALWPCSQYMDLILSFVAIQIVPIHVSSDHPAESLCLPLHHHAYFFK